MFVADIRLFEELPGPISITPPSAEEKQPLKELRKRSIPSRTGDEVILTINIRLGVRH
jgi:hypothetical protein